MLIDLYLLKTFFNDSYGAFYEEDLRAQYGNNTVSEAIHKGLIDHRYIPCGQDKRRCVCGISPKGIEEARNALQAHS